MEYLLAALVVIVCGGPLAFTVVQGSLAQDFQLIAIGLGPISLALGSVVTNYFAQKTISAQRAQIQTLQNIASRRGLEIKVPWEEGEQRK